MRNHHAAGTCDADCAAEGSKEPRSLEAGGVLKGCKGQRQDSIILRQEEVSMGSFTLQQGWCVVHMSKSIATVEQLTRGRDQVDKHDVQHEMRHKNRPGTSSGSTRIHAQHCTAANIAPLSACMKIRKLHIRFAIKCIGSAPISRTMPQSLRAISYPYFLQQAAARLTSCMTLSQLKHCAVSRCRNMLVLTQVRQHSQAW